MVRPFRSGAAAALSACLLLAAAGRAQSAVPALFPLDELRPGLRGEGLSVFAGDSISRFPVEILDRIAGRAPHELILVRCLGEQLARDGISQGMSGSPIYVDGRWLGAIAYNFSFAKEPLALVTPAAAMLALGEGRAAVGPRAAAGSQRALPYLAADWSPALAPLALPAAGPLPLAMGGLAPAALEHLAARYRPAGLDFMPLGSATGAAGGGATAAGGKAALVPGAALAVELLRGPITMAAIGTLSHVEGDKLWAFGHPFLGEGPSELPLAAAHIHAVLPSLYNSFKLGAMGERVGSLLVDGEAGIYGQRGPGPALLPLRVELDRDGQRESAAFELAWHRQLTPVLGRLALDGWLPGRLGEQERGALELAVTLAPAAGAPSRSLVRVQERFAGQGSALAAGAWLQSLLVALAENPEGPLRLDSLAVALNWRRGEEPLRLHDLSVQRVAARAGEAWQLIVHLAQDGRTDGSARDEWRLAFPDPSLGPVERLAGALPPGDYRLHVADGTSFERWNATRQPALYSLDGHAELLAVLARLGHSGQWVLWLEAPGEDSVAAGREFSLPLRYRALAPVSRRDALLSPKEPRRIVALQRLPVPDGAVAAGHLSLPVTVLDTPRRSQP